MANSFSPNPTKPNGLYGIYWIKERKLVADVVESDLWEIGKILVGTGQNTGDDATLTDIKVENSQTAWLSTVEAGTIKFEGDIPDMSVGILTNLLGGVQVDDITYDGKTLGGTYDVITWGDTVPILKDGMFVIKDQAGVLTYYTNAQLVAKAPTGTYSSGETINVHIVVTATSGGDGVTSESKPMVTLNPKQGVPTTIITLDETTLDLAVGEVAKVIATTDGTDRVLSWTVGSPTIATIDIIGTTCYVTGKAVGMTTLTCALVSKNTVEAVADIDVA